MITVDGYSKDPNIQPDGIAITWSLDMINACGGLKEFIRLFCQTMEEEDGIWYQKCKNAPTQDINYVYIIFAGRVRYRTHYGGHETGNKIVYDANGPKSISWSRIICAGPLVVAPRRIERKGFQGFRYTTKLF